MPDKAYVSEVFPPWTIAQQESVLADAIPEWPKVAVFRDRVGRLDRRNRNPDCLIDRMEMLRPTARKEPDRIFVASLAVLAWDENDFRAVLETVTARHGEIVSVDDKVVLTDTVPLTDAIDLWKNARRRSRTVGVQAKGARVSAQRKKAIAAIGVERIRPYWGMPSDEWPTWKLRQMAGTGGKLMAYNTIVAHLGVGRELAQKRYQAKLKRRAAMARRIEQIPATIPVMADAD